MSDKGKWPFDSNDHASAKGENARAARENELSAAEASRRQHLRNDRLIVGGKAHAKKHGLS
jgi:hypothetical protein